jgi:hypothetical protein
LKAEFGSQISDDLVFLRFLLGHKFNMTEIKKRLTAYCEWAEKIGLEDIRKSLIDESEDKKLSERIIDEEKLELHSKIIRWFPKKTFYSRIKNGNLMTFIHWGAIVPTMLMNCVTVDEFALYQAQTQMIAVSFREISPEFFSESFGRR